MVSFQDGHFVVCRLYSERDVHMNTNQNDVGKGFYLQWVLVSTIGFCVGSIVGLITPLFANISRPVAFGILFAMVFGAVGGLAQWLVLRGQIPEIGLWAPATALGCTIAAAIVATIVASLGEQVVSNFNFFVLFAAGYGVTGGLLQSLILRKQGVSVGWWLAATFLGSLLGSALNYPAGVALQSGPGHPTNIFFLILFGLGAGFGLGLGIITGGALVWLRRHPKPGETAAKTQGSQ